MLAFTITTLVIALLMGYILKIELVGKPINFWNCAYALLIVVCALALLILSNIVYYNVI